MHDSVRWGEFLRHEEFGAVRLDWLRTFLRLRNGSPTHDTCNRVFQALDPECFGACLARWTQSVRQVLGGEVVALDGKTVRRAMNQGQEARVIVSAWATESGLLLGQRKVRDKSNEITAMPELLRALEQGAWGNLAARAPSKADAPSRSGESDTSQETRSTTRCDHGCSTFRFP